MSNFTDIGTLELNRASRLLPAVVSPIFSKLKVRRLVGNLLRNRSFQLWNSGIKQKKYLHLGCGGNLFEDFINLDYGWSKGQDLCWDITRGLPLKSNSLSGIFTEHVLEHFLWHEAIQIFLPEAFRILKPGGTIRVVVPDAELCIDTYLADRARGATGTLFREPYHGGAQIPLTPMMHVNNTFRRLYDPLLFGHKFAYDFQTLEYFLHCAGFIDISRTSYMKGRDPLLLIDYKKRAAESLYVEAIKPV